MHLARCLWLLVLWAGVTIAAPQINEEIGRIEGAQYRILMPATWNGSLVLWCGGYSTRPVVFRAGERQSKLAVALVELGYAVAESGYSRGGFAVNEAIRDSDAL